jgi:glycerol-3-phosphate acyltransferase PlsY
MFNMLKFIALSFFAYLLGSIPWGLVLTRIFTSVDIRRHGSGNIGATNVKRLAGPALGALTLAGDVLKGAIPVWLALALTGTGDVRGEIYVAVVAFCAFAGHLYPVYLKFKDGGKGVATAAGCFFIISPAAGIVAILVFIMFVCWVDRISAGSLAAAAVLPIAVWVSSHSTIFTVCAVATTIFIYIRHKDNIKRLLAGTEPTISN